MFKTELGDRSINLSDPRRTIYLALSGGGFRATAHHLGVILAYLAHNQHQSLYVVNGVSGGAVAAGHFGRWWNNWRDAKHPKTGVEALRDFAQPLISILRLGVRWKLFSRFMSFQERPFPHKYDLSQRLGYNPVPFYNLKQSSLEFIFDEHLFHGEVLGFMFPSAHFVLTCTDLFSERPFFITNLGSGLRPHKILENLGESHNARIARGVCASAAYPPILPSVKWRLREKEASDYRLQTQFIRSWPGVESSEEPLDIYLTDGGVSDNLGITYFLQLLYPNVTDIGIREKTQIKYLMAYDIGLEGNSPLRPFSGTLKTARSAFDFLNVRKEYMNDFALRLVAREAGVRYMLLRPIDPIILGIEENILSSLKKVRTDLNRFSDTEIYALAYCGYRVGTHGLSEAGLISGEEFGKITPEDQFREIMDGLLHPLPTDQWAKHLASSDSRFGVIRFLSRMLGI